MRRLASMCGALLVTVVALSAQRAQPPAPDSPIMVIETAKGTIEIELFHKEAPKSVARVMDYVRRNFYRSQRFHRVVPSMVNFGDIASRDMTKAKRCSVADK